MIKLKCFPFSVPISEAKNVKEVAQQNADGAQPPAGHPPASTSQSTATKCPFLAAQMNHKNSNVFCKASLELQEDVQEMQADRKGMFSVHWSGGSSPELLVPDSALEHARSDRQHWSDAVGVMRDCRERLLGNVGVNDIPVTSCRVSLCDSDVGIPWVVFWCAGWL